MNNPNEDNDDDDTALPNDEMELYAADGWEEE